MFETKTWSHRKVNERSKEMSNNFDIVSAAVLLWVMQTSFEAAICAALLFSWHFSGCSYGNLLTARCKTFLNSCILLSLQFDAHVRNIANLDFSIYWSFMISAGLELPADLLSIVGLELLGRWKSYYFTPYVSYVKAMVFNPISSCQWTSHPTLCLAHCKLNL